MGRQCRECSAPVDEGPGVCFECGSLQGWTGAENKVECENHPGEDAVACCAVCGKPVCGDCCRTLQGRFYCDDPDHERLSEEWSVLSATASEFEADMIETNLRQNGFPPRVFPRESHNAMVWFPLLRRIRVMVPKSRFNEALGVLRSLGLAEPSEENQ